MVRKRLLHCYLEKWVAILLLVYSNYLSINVLLHKCAPNMDAHAIKMTLSCLDAKYV